MQSRLKFHTDYSGDSLRPLGLWSKPVFREIVSLHPVKDQRNMLSIHHFYKTLEFERQYEELFDLMSYTNDLCRSLPHHLVPPAFVSTGRCNLQISFGGGEGGGGRMGQGGNYLVNRSTAVFSNPTDIYDDETHWKFFNRTSLFDIGGVSPRRPLSSSLQAELKHMEGLLRKYFLRMPDFRDFNMDEVLHGYVRFLPVTGREFRLRVKLSNKLEKNRVRFISVRLLRQLSQETAVSVEPTQTRPIHVILPLLIVDDRFREFLRNFVEQGLRKGITLSLVIVIFSEMNADLVEGIVKQLTRGFPKAVVTIAISEGQFSLPSAVETGMSVLSNSDIAFVTDINTRIRQDFWSRCRDNTRLGKQVYFPTPFSAYISNPKTSLVNSSSSYPINHWTGQWAFYSRKNFCVVKRDYLRVGGFKDASFSSYFYQRLLDSGGELEVFQGPDPGLYRLWPARTCSSLNSRSPGRKACEALGMSHANFPPVDLADYLVSQDKSNSAFKS